MARTWGLTVVIVGAAIVLVEGVSSLVMFAGRLATEQERAPSGDRAHIQYDSALGWTGKPGVTLRDFYGPGLSVQTNAQGFRDTVDFTRAAPPGRSRVICSGDSFTFGYGVGNDQSWCALLPVFDSRVPALNLGLVGYGVTSHTCCTGASGMCTDIASCASRSLRTTFSVCSERAFSETGNLGWYFTGGRSQSRTSRCRARGRRPGGSRGPVKQ